MRFVYNLILGGIVFASLAASAQETLEFEGPTNAKIYVLEGNFKDSFSMPVSGVTWYYQTDFQATMGVNSGAITWAGSASAQAALDQGILSMNLSVAAKGVAKQAGSTVRWSATMAASGPATMQFYNSFSESVFITGSFNYKNMTLDEQTGQQIGTVSYRYVARNAYGQKFPFAQSPTVTTIPRPTIYSSEGEWREAAGDWSSEIDADVYPKGRISGTGNLIVGDAEDPYANVVQNIKGKVNSKTGVVSITGSGASKSTSKVKVTLNYMNSTGDTVAGKSSVNAYAQSRKF
jgi:hypothetical protein